MGFVICFFFQNQLFQNILSGILSKCQMVWIQFWSEQFAKFISCEAKSYGVGNHVVLLMIHCTDCCFLPKNKLHFLSFGNRIQLSLYHIPTGRG